MLIAWGRTTRSSRPPEPSPTSATCKTLEFHLLDAGHFALESNGDEIAELMREFLGKHVSAGPHLGGTDARQTPGTQRRRLHPGGEGGSGTQGRGGLRPDGQGGGWRAAVSEDLEGFLADLDMFYLGTASADGAAVHPVPWRPGRLPEGAGREHAGLRRLGGNRQYITVGNLSENPKAFLFLMDYANQQRVKVVGYRLGGRG